MKSDGGVRGDADCHSQCAHWLRNDGSRKNLRVIPRPVRRLVVGIRNTPVQIQRGTDCHTSDIGHWFAMTVFCKKCGGAGRCRHRPLRMVARSACVRADVGSELSAAGGRGSEVSEWPRSKLGAFAVRQRKNFGHRNRIIGPYGWLQEVPACGPMWASAPTEAQQEVQWAGDRKGRPYESVTRGAVRRAGRGQPTLHYIMLLCGVWGRGCKRPFARQQGGGAPRPVGGIFASYLFRSPKFSAVTMDWTLVHRGAKVLARSS